MQRCFFPLNSLSLFRRLLSTLLVPLGSVLLPPRLSPLALAAVSFRPTRSSFQITKWVSRLGWPTVAKESTDLTSSATRLTFTMETEFILAAKRDGERSILLVSPPFSSIAILTFNETNGNCPPRAVPRSLKSYRFYFRSIDRHPRSIRFRPVSHAIVGQARERRFSISDRGDSTRCLFVLPIFGAAPSTIFETQIVSSTIVPSTRITRLIRAVSRCKIVRDSSVTIPRRIYIYIYILSNVFEFEFLDSTIGSLSDPRTRGI